jgi:hypothetical protein
VAVWAMLATIWAVGVPFYLRFLVALCQELRRVKVCYLVRIEPTASGVPVIELRRKPLRARAA